MNQIYLSIGSNTDPQKNLPALVKLLRGKVQVIASSPVYESDGYLNAALLITTSLDPATLKEGVLVPIEDRLEREHDGPFVTADLDIVLVNNERLTYLERDIPDPGILRHAYVAVPLADIAPAYRHPVTGELLTVIARRLESTAVLKRRDDVSLS